MTSATRTATATTTNTSAVHIINLMLNVTRDVSALEHAWPRIGFTHVQSSLTEVTQLLMEGIADAVFVVFHSDSAVVRSYRYVLGTDMEAWGPPAGEPPLGNLPHGVKAIIAVQRSSACPEELFRDWITRLGWETSSLKMPGSSDYETYGAFTSGPYGMERAVYCGQNPPAPSHTTSGKKETNKR